MGNKGIYKKKYIVMLVVVLTIGVGVSLYMTLGRSIYINKSVYTMIEPTPPLREPLVEKFMSYEELLSYYGVGELPQEIDQTFTLVKEDRYVIYYQQDGRVYDDEIIFVYDKNENSQVEFYVEMYKESRNLEKGHEDYLPNKDKLKKSKINGEMVLITKIRMDFDEYYFQANFDIDETSYVISAFEEDMNKWQFLELLKEFLEQIVVCK